ncbi:hypothetical protein EUX98_g2483 [Antrodiella citrinella]|uniref:C3HC-type domain-containing protein n=1 Tax=Antrodiella citrinella TaxID=2447956 RepID=A0A4S4N148_9APHY|nr:hypothetical protein EUX98_g2483 [Antrodiella citrinella]
MSLAAGPSHAANEPNGNLLNDKNFKRKFQDAMQNLDEAVGPMEPLSSNQPPSKKPRVGRSLYATLAKYGIKREAKPEAPSDKLDSLSKTAPHLAAIIARTTSRARKALPLRFGYPPPTAPSISSAPSTSLPGISSESEYRPSSTTSFLTRLATFKLTTYANKPPAIDAVSASKCGWVNNGKDRLVCGICHVSWVVGGNQGMSRDAANALVEKQRQSLVDMHKDGCPWKTRQCDPSIYRVPLYAPVAMARELKSRAEKMDQVLQGVEIRHPMTASQVQSLLSTVKAVKQPSFSFSFDEPPLSVDGDTVMRDEPTALEPSPELSESAVLTALFGWSIVPPSDNFKSELCCPSDTSPPRPHHHHTKRVARELTRSIVPLQAKLLPSWRNIPISLCTVALRLYTVLGQKQTRYYLAQLYSMPKTDWSLGIHVSAAIRRPAHSEPLSGVSNAWQNSQSATATTT